MRGRSRRPVAVLAGTAALLGGLLTASPALTTSPALAAAPERLAEELTDRAGALSPGAVEEIEAAQDRLVDDLGLQLFVVVVDDFEGQSPQSWMAETARLSQLGDQDLLLAVTVDGQQLELRAPEGSRLDQGRVRTLQSQGREALAAGDVDRAVTTVADGLVDSQRLSSSDRAARTLWWTLGIGAVLAAAATVALVLWRRARTRTRAAEDLARARELAREHGTLAVALDDALAAAELEVGFAGAEFDPPLIASMSETVSGARDQGLEGHRRRGAVVSGPVDEPHWLVAPARAREELESVVDLTRAALERVGTIPAGLDALRHQSDLVPTRVQGLRELAARPGRSPEVQAQVAQLLDRAQADVDAGRPEAALIPLQTVVALLGPDEDAHPHA